MIKRYALLSFLLIFIACLTRLPKLPSAPFNLKTFGKITVLHDGRLKPLNAAVTSTLLLISEKQVVSTPSGKSLRPLEWALTLITDPKSAHLIPVFLIDHPQVKSLINQGDSTEKRFSFNDIHSRLETIYSQAGFAAKTDAHKRNSYQRDIIQLQTKINLYLGIQSSMLPPPIQTYTSDINRFQALIPTLLPILTHRNPTSILTETKNANLIEFINYFQRYRSSDEQSSIRLIPSIETPRDTQLWVTAGEHILSQLKDNQPLHPLISQIGQLLDAYKDNNHLTFNTLASQIVNASHYGTPPFGIPLLSPPILEHYFVLASPFFISLLLYIVSLLTLFISYIRFETFFRFLTAHCFKVAFFLHTIGLLCRLYISGRPPVTNLYSSAVFVGWFAILMAILLEKRFKNTIGTLVASMIGFLTLIIAHHLSFQGDTMALMQAVLDSNFWLTTHVITVTMGYSGTYLSGFIGIIYILFGVYSTKLTPSLQKDLYKMSFGIACFSLLFSFIGTVLGGIWADQSWGRFWGWDPKENGALLIIIWLAIMLHARIGGFIRDKGFMILAIFGNIVTSFSWFGVNMLGIGLHSYGFMDQALFGLILFIASQLIIIGIGCLPNKYWKSFQTQETH